MSNIRTVTALTTPFCGDRVDEAGLAAAIERQVRAGIDAVVVCDVTGEGFALDERERDLVLSMSLARADGRLAVIAATGTNDTARSIALTMHAQALGADGVLVTVPYYSKPSRAGVADHFRRIAAETHLPVIVDDDPQRVAIEGGAALLAALSDVENIVGIRHGAGRLAAFTRLAPNLRRRYHHYCGEDADLPAFLACGGHGAISAFGNLVPQRLAATVRGAAGASTLFSRDVAGLAAATGGQWDAAVVKAASGILHDGSEGVRLPLVEIDADMREALRCALAEMGEGAGLPVPQAVA